MTSISRREFRLSALGLCGALLIGVLPGLAPNAAPLRGHSAQGADPPAAGNNSRKHDGRANADEKPKAVPPVRNPVIDLIKRGLGPQKQPRPAPTLKTPPLPAGAPAKQNADRHSLDSRAPYDRKGSDWLRKAAAHAQAGEWNDALDLLQRVTDQAEDSLYRTDAGEWVSIRAEADHLRSTAPARVLADYRTKYGGLARQLLNDALHDSDPAAFGRVAKGYFHTDAGYEAANRLGSMHLDRGEFALAAHWFSALWQARAPLTTDGLWRGKAAYALKQAGQAELAREIIASAKEKTVELGGHRHDLARWLNDLAPAAGPTEAPLADWLTFFGTARRTGTAVGGEPLLLARWRHPLTASHRVRSQIEQLAEDLADQGTCVPTALFPTLAAGRVIFRTLNGVQVVDAVSGRLLWETDDLQPLEQMLTGEGGMAVPGGAAPPGNRVVRGGRGGNWNGRVVYTGGTGEYSPLCNLLYRNASFGIVSSDGQQLFVVDDPLFLSNLQPGNAGQWENGRMGPADAGSRLSAYDLDSGRPLWEAGGIANGEPFDPPLAGYFFFGAPVADAGELYVVAEATSGVRTGQIRLLALDPKSGTENWSQLIAYSDPTPIERDIGRRWRVAPVAIDRGLIICPTTVGWVVAIDRVTHSLLWGQRIQKPAGNAGRVKLPTEQHEAMAMVQNIPLHGAWAPAPPVLAEGRVILTAAETQRLICLDQFTGKELWSKPRNSGLYLAGVYNGKVLVVGRDVVTAFDLTNGSSLWTLKTPAPSGRGVAIAGHYEFPLAIGEIWSIDLKSGTVADKSFLPPQSTAIGNLAMYRGMLLSLDASGLTAFEQRDAVRDVIAARKRENPADPWAHVREAEIELLSHNYSASLAALRRIAREEIPADIRDLRRKLLVDALHAMIRSDFSRSETDTDLRELAAAVETPEERRDLRQLEIDLYAARGEFSKAFDSLLELAANSPDSLVPRDDTPTTMIRGRLAVSGKLTDLLRSAPEGDRAILDRRVAALADRSLKGATDDQEQFLELFSAHPAAVRVRTALAETYANRRELAPSEHLLRQLAGSDDRAVAGAAIERLARLMVQFDLPADAALHYRTLERHFGDLRLPDGRTMIEMIRKLRTDGDFPLESPPLADWQAMGVRVERMGANYFNHLPQELPTAGSTAPYFQRFRFEIEPARGRLNVTDAASDELRWSLPLRTHAASAEGTLAMARASGHVLTLLHRGVLHCLSPVESRVLWTRALDNRLGVAGSYGRNTSPLQPMQSSMNLGNRQIASQVSGNAAGPLAIVNDEIVCHQGRRGITVLDARTGEERWTHTGTRHGGLVFGGRNVLYVRSNDGRNSIALRVEDGKRLDIPKLDETLARAMYAVGDAFLLPAPGGPSPGLRLYDPLLQKDLWKITLGRRVLMNPLEGNRLALIEIDAQGGNFQVLHLVTGERQSLGTLTVQDTKGNPEYYTLADNQNVYLIVNKGTNRNFYSEQVPSVRTNGVLWAFDPVRGKLRWKQAVSEQNLLLERLDFSPWLVFASRKYEQKGKLYFWSLHLVAIDKLSGAKLLDDRSPSQPGIRSVNVSAADRFIELRGYNDRVRLYPIENSASVGESGG
jgi:outer membrane protein assembly factor BamB/tetratricopeptide (TPR) repeat protein